MTNRSASAQPRSEGPARRPALHRELHFFKTTSVSIGVMAPTLAMSVTGVAAAAALGRAAPLAFVVAALGVGLVAYGFVRLAGEFSHAVWPVPPPPYEYFPYLVLGWLAVGIVITAVVPGFSGKVGAGLERVRIAEAEAEAARGAPVRGP